MRNLWISRKLALAFGFLGAYTIGHDRGASTRSITPGAQDQTMNGRDAPLATLAYQTPEVVAAHAAYQRIADAFPNEPRRSDAAYAAYEAARAAAQRAHEARAEGRT
jgi:hypothetical protein